MEGTCLRCPQPGSNCTLPGSELAHLQLRPGYFRLTSNSLDIRSCPDVSKGVDSGCQGNAQGPCKVGLAGVFCRECNSTSDRRHYYSSETSSCLDCDGKGSGFVALISTFFVLVIAVSCLACAAPLRQRVAPQEIGGEVSPEAHAEKIRRASDVRRLSLERAEKRTSGAARILALPDSDDGGMESRSYKLSRWASGRLEHMRSEIRNVARKPLTSVQFPIRLRLLWSFYQVAGLVPSIYKLELPSAVTALLGTFTSLANLNLSGLSYPLQCLGMGGFAYTLAFWSIFPFLLMLAIPAGLCGFVLRTRRASAELGAPDEMPFIEELWYRSLPPLLWLMFLDYPVVTTIAFEAFDCAQFEDGSSFLRADFSISCNSDDWRALANAAVLSIVVHAFAIPGFFLFLLMRTRTTLRSGQVSRLTNALSFLHRSYHPSSWYWEFFEMFRKLLLVGFARVMWPGTLMQAIIGLSVTLVALALLYAQRPYKSKNSGFLAVLMAFKIGRAHV